MPCTTIILIEQTLPGSTVVFILAHPVFHHAPRSSSSSCLTLVGTPPTSSSASRRRRAVMDAVTTAPCRQLRRVCHLRREPLTRLPRRAPLSHLDATTTHYRLRLLSGHHQTLLPPSSAVGTKPKP
ncbi:hypothetical protein L1987_58948 [Smallanthus sonchifolius]|uniref:Uncharacterized protein n=1 Tax=Smallanthus sonchifolius TaxID=185202 RepID=A0ACB9D3W0_9ASTR|nr:hypothetical protein L1987_58948 [Smallanthus sonchifolius]